MKVGGGMDGGPKDVLLPNEETVFALTREIKPSPARVYEVDFRHNSKDFDHGSNIVEHLWVHPKDVESVDYGVEGEHRMKQKWCMQYTQLTMLM